MEITISEDTIKSMLSIKNQPEIIVEHPSTANDLLRSFQARDSN